jgi:hypothetical protein
VTPREVRAAVADSDFTPIAGLQSRGLRMFAVVSLIAFGAAAGAGVFYWLQHGFGTLTPEAAPAKPAPPSKAPPAKPAAVPAAIPTPAAEATPVPVPPPPPPQLLTAEQLRRFQGYGAADNALLRERLAVTRERLMREPDESHSIELFIAENSDPARTERFLLRARELVPLAEINVIPLASGKSYRLWVTYGVYANREAAAEAARQLPVKYQKAFKLEPRGLVALRASI